MTPCLPFAPAFSTSTPRLAGRAHDVVAILIDHVADFPRVQPRVRTDVRDRPAEANVIAHEIDTRWIFEQIVNVGLTNAEASVDVATIVRFSSISHVPCSVRNQSLNSAFERTSQGIGLRERLGAKRWLRGTA
jgi:hypothetical protein